MEEFAERNSKKLVNIEIHLKERQAEREGGEEREREIRQIDGRMNE